MTGASRRRLAAVLAGITALAGVAACRPDQTSYFPLEPGWRHGYRMAMTIEGMPEVEHSKSVSLNLHRRAIDGVTATPRLYQDGRIVYYVDDGTGVRPVAFQEPGDGVTAALPGQYLFKYPLAAGARWRTPGRTVLLTQRFLSSKALPITIGIDLDYTVEGLDETVRVPAGRFAHCLKLVATGETTVGAADNQRTLVVRVDLAEWYAPGVGLIKSERSERAGEERAGNSRLTTELEHAGKRGWLD